MTNQARIDELKIFFQDTLNNLAAIDSQRIQASMSLFQSKTPDDVANSCIDLQDLDETSQERLEQLKTILLDFQILIQKEDVSDSDYKNVQKETVGLLGLLIKTINKILKARKQEKSALENLVKYLNRLESKKPFVAFMYKRNFNKIKNSIHDEIKAFREFYLLNKRSNDLI
jgi:endoglucanase Acf2